MSNAERLGKAAWEAYRESVGGKSFNGEPLPTWEEMTKDPKRAAVRKAWIESGIAAGLEQIEISSERAFA